MWDRIVVEEWPDNLESSSPTDQDQQAGNKKCHSIGLGKTLG